MHPTKRNADKAEREAILARMAEDKAERLARQAQVKAAEQEAAADVATMAAAAASSAGGDSSSLVIRAEEGAHRHTFPASTTLLQVRDWLIDEQRRQDAVLPRGATSHVLTSNEDLEAVRLGRENFERQTARLREEARAMRLAAATGPDGRVASSETRIFFVTLMPRAEFLSEEAMGTTLAQVRRREGTRGRGRVAAALPRPRTRARTTRPTPAHPHVLPPQRCADDGRLSHAPEARGGTAEVSPRFFSTGS
jgi:hypothetical protein